MHRFVSHLLVSLMLPERRGLPIKHSIPFRGNACQGLATHKHFSSIGDVGELRLKKGALKGSNSDLRSTAE